MGQSFPDIIAYNAGTDCMVGDPLGQLSISPQVSELNKSYLQILSFPLELVSKFGQ